MRERGPPPKAGSDAVTGPELKQIRKDLSDAIGRQLSAADMARLCGLAPGGADTIRRWEVSGPSGSAAELLRILAMASDRHPIIENFNVFDRFNIPERDRPARRQEFRDSGGAEVRGAGPERSRRCQPGLGRGGIRERLFSRYHEVGEFPRRNHEPFGARTYRALVLLAHGLRSAPAFGDIALQAAIEADTRVGLHVHFGVQESS